MAWKYVVSAVVAYIACFLYYIDFSNESPLLRLNGIQIIEYYGYEGEEHLVESLDGRFVIKLHRIGKGESKKNVVLFIPGIHCSSELQFGLGPQYDISYMAHNSGIDYWVANNRGNSNARAKENASLTDDELTNFSFHEQGIYDISAQIDYILNKTSQTNLQIIAGSLGASVVISLLATKPEYNQKVSKLLLLGPTGPFTRFTTYTQKVVGRIMNFHKGISDYMAMSNAYRIEVMHILCSHPMMPMTCKQMIDLYLGFDFKAIPDGHEAAALRLMFTGPWTGLYEHMFQLAVAKRYVMRDYGKTRNWQLYNAGTPPDYNMSSITVPVKIYYVEGDLFFDDESYNEMMQMIPNIKATYEIKKPFKHGNFIVGTGAEKHLAADIISTLLSKKSPWLI